MHILSAEVLGSQVSSAYVNFIITDDVCNWVTALLT